MAYVWESPDWPQFRLDESRVTAVLHRVEAGRAQLAQKLRRVGFDTQQEHFLNSLSAEVLESSLIENEVYSAAAVRSSIARKLGLGAEPARPEKRAEGLIRVLLEATQNYAQPLTEERIRGWHRLLLAHDRRVAAGEYRTDPIYVASGGFGKETVHFEGPPPERVAAEMSRFGAWLADADAPPVHPWLRSSLAHFWFVTVHPFEDGNGRIARAIAEYFLARADGSPERYYSVSASLNAQRKAYYQALETAQRGSLDVTGWMTWSLSILEQGIERSLGQVERTLANGEIWKRALEAGMNVRQRAMLPKLLEGFEGALTTQKWALLCNCSQDSATRDISAWVGLGILEKSESGGRSTHYRLASP